MAILDEMKGKVLISREIVVPIVPVVMLAVILRAVKKGKT